MKIVIACLILSIMFLSCTQSGEKSRQENQHEEVTTVNSQTIATILQLTIDAKELQKFLHPGVSSRDTLYIYSKNLPDDLSLTKSGIPVKISKTFEEGKNCLVIDSISVSNAEATVNISYPIEGVKGKFSFKYSGEKWVLQDSDLVEI